MPLKTRFGAVVDVSETLMQARVQWAALQLPALGRPVNPNTLVSMVAWSCAEGGGLPVNGVQSNEVANNPLNDTQQEPGSVGVVDTGNGIFVQAYVSEAQGIQAVVTTLTNGLYNMILGGLSASEPPESMAGIIGASPWGTIGAVVAECIPESASAVAAYWTPPPPPVTGAPMFIDQVPNFPNQTWMFVPNGLASFWRKCPAPVNYPVEHDTTGAWFGDWDHMENGVLVKP